MSGFYEPRLRDTLQNVRGWRLDGDHYGPPQVAIIASSDASVAELDMDTLLERRDIEVLAVSPFALTTGTVGIGPSMLWHATVLYQARLIPNGEGVDDE